MRNKSSASASSASNLRTQLLEFLIDSAHELQVIPIVKYTALSLFADRFYDSFRSSRLVGVENLGHWLFKPIRESNLQLFALISLWISSKIHNSSPLSVKTLKSFGDKSITEQHFTARDFLEAEIVFLQVLDYELGAGNVAFIFLEDLLSQLKGMAKVGELVNLEACMDIMDLLYETEDSSLLYSCSLSLAASTLVASYVITVPKQRWEFPVLPWGKDFFSCEFIENFKTQYVLDGVIDFLLEPFLFC
ncbi:hypothetical protein K2173_017216 [Erythroxylum novogranatense]|uniref:B-like cyclin n=1 Tax=Erythroxylum novogranatense TaxID=1862640 RepID=A0AAV8U8V9_9ROSI|nr:hypothetical protein K2173_017216 [Erythroxylum novogranatense]